MRVTVHQRAKTTGIEALNLLGAELASIGWRLLQCLRYLVRRTNTARSDLSSARPRQCCLYCITHILSDGKEYSKLLAHMILRLGMNFLDHHVG
jgi:hypothetical protein